MCLYSNIQASARRLDRSHAQEAHYCFDFTRLLAGPDRAPRIEALQGSFDAARLFAQAADFAAARSRLCRDTDLWPKVPRRRPARVLVIANGSLAALALVAETHIANWKLVLEEGDFSGEYIAPLCAKASQGVEFVPTAQLPLVWEERRHRDDGLAAMWITFCDRPVHTGSCSLTIDLQRGKYHLSVVDALMMASGFDEVFVLGRELHQIVVQHAFRDGENRVSGATLMQYTRQALSGLLELIEFCPEQYLGMASLATRSERYRALARNNKRALLRSLLQYCQTNGLPLPEEVYHDFLLKTAAPAT